MIEHCRSAGTDSCCDTVNGTSVMVTESEGPFPVVPSPPHTQARGAENIFEVSNGRIILRVIHKQLSLGW